VSTQKSLAEASEANVDARFSTVKFFSRIGLVQSCILRNKLVAGSAQNQKPRVTPLKTTRRVSRATDASPTRTNSQQNRNMKHTLMITKKEKIDASAVIQSRQS
jgi:hypothetical protein